MAFDVEMLFIDSASKIHRFAQEHTGETFYAFVIDASSFSKERTNSDRASEVKLSPSIT